MKLDFRLTSIFSSSPAEGLPSNAWVYPEFLSHPPSCIVRLLTPAGLEGTHTFQVLERDIYLWKEHSLLNEIK